MQNSMPIRTLRRNRRFKLSAMPKITGKLLSKSPGAATVTYDGEGRPLTISLSTLVIPLASEEQP